MSPSARLRVGIVVWAALLAAGGTAAAVALGGDGPPTALRKPVVTGAPWPGQTLSTSAGEWSGTAPISYAYQWRRCDAAGASCRDIAGATSQRYQVTQADVGSTLRSRVFATNPDGSDYLSSKVTVVVPAHVGGSVPAPAQGAYLGAWTSPNTGLTVDQREAQIGRRYAIVHRYHGWGEVFPDAQEQEWASGGRTLFFALESRIYGGGIIRWADIASGAQDDVIDAMAARVRALGRPVLMDFAHEPEEAGPVSTTFGDMGSAADFVAAYRHVVERFRADGATNVAWVWTVMGYSGYQSVYPSLYPGDDVVDWIGWDPYNWYSCHDSAWKSFARKVSGFYSWLVANGHANKPFILSEFGSRENDDYPQAKGQWFRDAVASLKAGSFPNLRALVYFDSNKAGECDWRVDTSSASLDGWRDMAQDPFLDPSAQ